MSLSNAFMHNATYQSPKITEKSKLNMSLVIVCAQRFHESARHRLPLRLRGGL